MCVFKQGLEPRMCENITPSGNKMAALLRKRLCRHNGQAPPKDGSPDGQGHTGGLRRHSAAEQAKPPWVRD